MALKPWELDYEADEGETALKPWELDYEVAPEPVARRGLGDMPGAGLVGGAPTKTIDPQKAADMARSIPAGAVKGTAMAMRGLGTAYDVAERNASSLIDSGLRAAGMDDVADALATPTPWWLNPGQILQRPGESLYALGTSIGAPKERQNTATAIGEGLGQIGAQITAAILSGGAPSAVSSLSLYGQGVDQMEQLRQEKAPGREDFVTDSAVVGGGAITALTERYGLDKILNRIPPKIKNAVLRRVADIAAGFGIEAGQEVTENVLQRLTALATFAPDIDVLEGVDQEAIVGGSVGAIARGLLQTALPGKQGVETQEAPRTPGVVEGAGSNVTLTPEDIASPLPNDAIEAGKRVIAEAAAVPEADEILRAAGLAGIGSRVEVDLGDGNFRQATITDAFRAQNAELNVTEDGVRFTFDDGSDYEDYLTNLRGGAIAVRPVATAQPEGAATPATATGTTTDQKTGATIGPVAAPVTSPAQGSQPANSTTLDPEAALQRTASEMYADPNNTRSRAEIISTLRNQQETSLEVQNADARKEEGQQEDAQADAEGQATRAGDEGLGNADADEAQDDGVLTPETIHRLADERSIPWDDAPEFMARTKQITGKERLDDLTPQELANVRADILANPKGWSGVAPAAADDKAPPVVQSQPRSGTDAIAKAISKATGGKGVRVYRYGEENLYDPLLGSLLIRDDNISTRSAAKAVKKLMPEGWRKAKVRVTLPDGTTEEETAGQMAGILRSRVERAVALLDCVAS